MAVCSACSGSLLMQVKEKTTIMHELPLEAAYIEYMRDQYVKGLPAKESLGRVHSRVVRVVRMGVQGRDPTADVFARFVIQTCYAHWARYLLVVETNPRDEL